MKKISVTRRAAIRRPPPDKIVRRHAALGRPRAARREAGFTLVEIVVALVLLGSMMLLIHSGLAFALRSWDAGDANGRRVADWRITENFLRREVSEVFPLRWKDPNFVKFAFDGERGHVRFVSSRAAGVSLGGLSLVGMEVEAGADARAPRNLVMRRAMASDEVNDFEPLRDGQKSILVAGVDSVEFGYFGSENDFTEPTWTDEWKYPARMPTMVRLRVRTAGGEVLPEVVMRIMTGEEAGCLESAFQRQCRPRRPSV
jgi:general secretion pathway protein J